MNGEKDRRMNKEKKNTYHDLQAQKQSHFKINYNPTLWREGVSTQLHPFRNQSPEIWDQFWDNAPKIGRSQFRRDRDSYDLKEVAMHPYSRYWTKERKSYWDEVDPNDMQMVLHKSTPVYGRRNMACLTINTKRFAQDLPLPQQKTEGSAGFDLSTPFGFTLPPGESMTVPVGFAFEIPKGYFGLIKPRSSLALAGLTTDAGVIDQDYIGQIKVITVNRNRLIAIRIDKGERFAQLIILPYLVAKLKEECQLQTTKRGEAGFGSTGNNAAVIKKTVDATIREDEQDKMAFKYGERLQPEQRKQLEELVGEYQDITAINFSQLKDSAKGFVHEVDTGESRPIKQAPYRTNPVYRDWAKTEIAKLLKGGVITYSKSPWASPIVIVPKKEIVIDPITGERKEITAPRLCVDYRELNKVTVTDGLPMPLVEDLLEMVGEDPEFFSSLDLITGYHQVWLSEDARKKSAFVTQDGQYEYLRMPFGMCNAPATFQRIMNTIFEDLIGKCVTVYIDDIQLYTKTFKEHLYYLEEIFQRLRKHGFYLKAKKCTLATHEMKYLGFIVNKQGIVADPSKIEAMTSFRRPTHISGVRAFLGLIRFYRRFIPDCSKITYPLNVLLRNNGNFHWGNDQEEAYQTIIKKLTQTPVLKRPEWDKPFTLCTDGSSIGLGAVLSQKDKQGRERVIAYASKGTNDAEANYEATKLECLAVKWAIGHFHHYLIGRHFTLITDHSALQWLFKRPNPTGIYARWIMKLQEYDFKVIHRPGKQIPHVDALSRAPPPRENTSAPGTVRTR